MVNKGVIAHNWGPRKSFCGPTLMNIFISAWSIKDGYVKIVLFTRSI